VLRKGGGWEGKKTGSQVKTFLWTDGGKASEEHGVNDCVKQARIAKLICLTEDAKTKNSSRERQRKKRGRRGRKVDSRLTGSCALPPAISAFPDGGEEGGWRKGLRQLFGGTWGETDVLSLTNQSRPHHKHINERLESKRGSTKDSTQ